MHRLSLALLAAHAHSRGRLSRMWRFRLWQNRIRERDELAALDDRMLRDIGISKYDVLQTVNKPFWRA